MKTDNQTFVKLPALLVIMVISLLLSFNWPLFATTTIDRDYQLKSAFISNFIRYTLWESLPNNNFNFCTTDRLVTTIAELNLEQERWYNLKPIFYTVTPGKEHQCQVLFINHDKTQLWSDHLKSNHHQNILIIGEKTGFIQNAGHINFYQTDNNLRFEVNSEQLKMSNISISSNLLRLARQIDTRGEHNGH